MKSPLTFTMALWAKVDAGNGDQLAAIQSVRRAQPFERMDVLPLPPAFFHALHRIGDVYDRQGAEAS